MGPILIVQVLALLCGRFTDRLAAVHIPAPLCSRRCYSFSHQYSGHPSLPPFVLLVGDVAARADWTASFCLVPLLSTRQTLSGIWHTYHARDDLPCRITEMACTSL